MDPPGIAGASTAAIELFAAVLFAVAFFRRRADREYGIASLFAIAAALHATASFAVASSPHLTAAASTAIARTGGIGLVAAAALSVHFALAYRGGRSSRWAVLAPYAIAALPLALGAARGFDFGILGAGSRPIDHAAPFGIATSATTVVASLATLVLAARTFLTGRRGALAVVMGATLFLATALNDAAFANGWLSTGYLGDAGLAALVVAIATTPSAGYAVVTQELGRSTLELGTRTRELRRSYEELRAAQEELVKKEQLAAVGELAAVIAHEVRNPLAIIANAVAGLRRQAIRREDHDVLLAILDEETSRLNRLVTDLLRYARPVNIQRSHIALADLLERALALASTGTKTIRTELKMEAHEGRLWGDANLLRQVFDNLIDNAVQAMASGGVLTVRVRAATEDGADGLAVDIIDTGEGMDTQVRSRALDPFFTTRPSGTGLGLAIVDRIVDAHGGHLAIDSRAGEGTTVTVFLPHGSPSEPPPRSRMAKPSGDGPFSSSERT